MISIFFFILNVSLIFSIDIRVPQDSEDCYYLNLRIGQRSGIRFDVEAGQGLRIDCHITAPSGSGIWRGSDWQEAHPTFVAEEDGLYKFCFLNFRNDKIVDFDLYVGELPKDPSSTPDDGMPHAKELPTHDDLARVDRDLNILSSGLQEIMKEQKVARSRYNGHRATAESTNSRVAWWSSFEFVMVILCALAQVMYTKRFFEKRRVI